MLRKFPLIIPKRTLPIVGIWSGYCFDTLIIIPTIGCISLEYSPAQRFWTVIL